MKAYAIRWARRLLGVEADIKLLAQCYMDLATEHTLLRAWVKNLDTALWRVDQHLDKVKWGKMTSSEDTVTDLKAVADKLRDQMSKTKQRFPIHREDWKDDWHDLTETERQRAPEDGQPPQRGA